MIRARDIAVSLGGTGRPESGLRYRCRCPVHGDATTPSLTVKDDPCRRDGIDVKCWSAGCDPIAIKKELARRGLLKGEAGPLLLVDRKVTERAAIHARRGQAKRKGLAQWLWQKAEPSAAEVARYLSGRAIDLGRIGGVPSCLRYEVSAMIPETEPRRYGPAMIAAVTDALGEIVAVHQTFLSFTGAAKARLAQTKFIIGPSAGAAVRLLPIADDGTLGVAEGIETALSAAELTGIPTWAGLNTSGMIGFAVPPAVRRVVIFTDHDPINPRTGKRPGSHAAETLRDRLKQQCIACEIRYPGDGLKDFNDELRRRKCAERVT